MKIKILILVLPLLLGSCATMGKKFKPTMEADVGFFADNTIAMLNEVNFGFTKRIALYTKEFFNYEEPEEKRFREIQDLTEMVLKRMVRYSIFIVTIVETEGKPSARVEKYADYMQQFDDKVLTALELEKNHYNDLIKDIRSQKDFRKALIKAQPIINSAGRYVELRLEDMEQAALELTSKIDKKIDAEFADVIRYQETLEDEKYSILSGLEKLYLSSKGDKRAYKEFLESKIIKQRNVTSKGHPTADQVVKMADHLMGKMDRLSRIEKKIKDDWELYRSTHRELDKILAQVTAEIKQIRVITLVWTRAHQKMAAGRTSPAEWFDINETPVHMMNMGRKLVF